MEINLKRLKKIIRDGEELDLERKSTYLYHTISIPKFEDLSPVLSIVDNGILSKNTQVMLGISKEDVFYERTNNGNFYVSFSSDPDQYDQPFDIGFIVEQGPDFIKADKHSKLVEFLWNTPIPLRSGLENEYQILDYVSTIDIKGIQMRFDKLLSGVPSDMNMSESEYVSHLINVVNTIYDKIDQNGYYIPIVNAKDKKIIDRVLFQSLQGDLNQMNPSYEDNQAETKPKFRR